MDVETREVSFFVLLKSCIPRSLEGARVKGQLAPSPGLCLPLRSAPPAAERRFRPCCSFLARVCCLQEHISRNGVIGRKFYDGLGQIAPDRSS